MARNFSIQLTGKLTKKIRQKQKSSIKAFASRLAPSERRRCADELGMGIGKPGSNFIFLVFSEEEIRNQSHDLVVSTTCWAVAGLIQESREIAAANIIREVILTFPICAFLPKENNASFLINPFQSI